MPINFELNSNLKNFKKNQFSVKMLREVCSGQNKFENHCRVYVYLYIVNKYNKIYYLLVRTLEYFCIWYRLIHLSLTNQTLIRHDYM